MQNIENTIPIGTILQGKSYKYEIIKVLGQGSFGITYLASIKMTGDLGAIDAFVAIKEFFMSDINGRDELTVTTSNKDGLFDKYKRKFIKEAQSLGKLKHPNIVRVLESFKANNTIYYAMDFIEGGSLDEYISQKGYLTEKETIAISYQILDALSYMHSKKMLHLDLKPSNIMMNAGKPVLIDFGLSKQYDNDGCPESSTTIGAGTPGYAPIEQSNYNGEISDSHCLPVSMDIYALGATMFKMLTGKRPPLASNILNIGFPEHELKSQQISLSVLNVIKHLMSPMWKDRPNSDDAVKSLFNELSKNEHEGTETVGEVEIVNIEPPKKNVDKKKHVLIGGAILFITACIIIGIIATANNKAKYSSVVTAYGNDTLAIEPIETLESSVVLPDIKYNVTGNTDFGSNNSQLCATIDGEKVVIGSINYVFGPDNMGNMNIFEQDDFNGDGIRDVLVYDANIGSGGGSTWAFITYAGDNTFDKSNLFSEASYYEPEITTVNGQKVIDFIKVDMGQRIVKERHGLKNGNVVSFDLPKSKTQAYTPLKSVIMEDLGENGSFNFDLNGDGINEKITTTGSYHFGRSFMFKMNGREYDFTVENALWGAGTLHVLKTKTNGVHDIMVEQDTRLMYKWDGATYVTE